MATGPTRFPSIILKRGVVLNDSGPEVKILQTFLSKHFKLKLKADGKFGPKTQAAVKKLQKISGLKPDGEIGKKSLAFLKEGDDEEKSGSGADGASTKEQLRTAKMMKAEGTKTRMAVKDFDQHIEALEKLAAFVGDEAKMRKVNPRDVLKRHQQKIQAMQQTLSRYDQVAKDFYEGWPCKW